MNFCIEALHLSEQIALLNDICGIRVLHRSPTNNALVIFKNSDQIYSKYTPQISKNINKILKNFFLDFTSNNDESQTHNNNLKYNNNLPEEKVILLAFKEQTQFFLCSFT